MQQDALNKMMSAASDPHVYGFWKLRCWLIDILAGKNVVIMNVSLSLNEPIVVSGQRLYVKGVRLPKVDNITADEPPSSPKS